MLARLPLVAGLFALALAIGLGSVAIADGIRHRNQSDVVTVTGSAKRTIVSDYVIWDAAVTSQRPTAAAAADELAGWATRVRGFLRGSGALDSEVTVEPIATETVTTEAGIVKGYKLTRSFEVRSSRVKAIADLAERSSTLLAGGLPLSAAPIQYVYTKLGSLRPQLLADAVRDAEGRARALVGATGGQLGSLRGVDVGVFQVTSPNSTEVSDYGVYDTSTLDKEVTAVVDATFGLR
jgi:hypothetical protein